MDWLSYYLQSAQVRHKVFISYHHDDQAEVYKFVRTYGQNRVAFIYRALGVGMQQDIIDSTDTDYVMRRIREQYLKDSTVTIVLIGQCAWARRYVDWEIQASLRHGPTVMPNGLLGIVLPSAGRDPVPPERLRWNLKTESGPDSYASWYWYPRNERDLVNWIEEAFQARTARAHLIANPRERFKHNKQCP